MFTLLGVSCSVDFVLEPKDGGITKDGRTRATREYLEVALNSVLVLQPLLPSYASFLTPSGTKFDTQTLRQLLIIQGAILMVLADQLGDGVFYLREKLRPILLHPSVAFKGGIPSRARMASSILHAASQGNDILPLLSTSVAHLLSLDSDIKVEASRLGSFIYRRLYELHNGKLVDDDEWERLQGVLWRKEACLRTVFSP